MTERIDALDQAPSMFIDSPGEAIVQSIVSEIKKVPQWLKLFGDAIDSYQRMDYGIRNFPACRVYCGGYVKEYDSWFINGDITFDVIFPPSIRRVDLQQYQATVSTALLQQFRRPSFFETLNAEIPGLNELGKRFDVDQEKGFVWQEGSEIAPLTQIKLNFRIDLREWDAYLESDDRTKDDPFERTLANLDRIVTSIQAIRDDDGAVELTITSDQTV